MPAEWITTNKGMLTRLIILSVEITGPMVPQPESVKMFVGLIKPLLPTAVRKDFCVNVQSETYKSNCVNEVQWWMWKLYHHATSLPADEQTKTFVGAILGSVNICRLMYKRQLENEGLERKEAERLEELKLRPTSQHQQHPHCHQNHLPHSNHAHHGHHDHKEVELV